MPPQEFEFQTKKGRRSLSLSHVQPLRNPTGQGIEGANLREGIYLRIARDKVRKRPSS
jgi:hypothetical protein